MQEEQPASGYQAFITNTGLVDENHLRQENNANNQPQVNIDFMDSGE